MSQENGRQLGRRAFLSKSSKLALGFLAANAGIYAVGSVFSNLDGNLVAGAKTCTAPMPKLPSGCGPLKCNNMIQIGTLTCGSYVCDPGTGTWISDGNLECLCPDQACK